MQQSIPRPRWFVRLAVATASLTLGLIVFGAIVRVTDSGLGCGNDWPLCNGRIFPPLDNATAVIEWSHRAFALLIGVLGLGMLFVVLRVHRRNRMALTMTVLAALLYIVQSGLGRSVVKEDLSPTLVTLHLGTAMLLFAALLLAGVFVKYASKAPRKADHVTTLSYITAALSLVIILTGTLVRGSGATLACIDWPLCNGDIFPVNQGQLATIHMTHRLAVLAFGISLLVLVWFVLRDRKDRQTRLLAIGALVIYLAQAGVGALFVLTGAAPIWGAAHVGLAASTWAALVILSAIEWLNSRVGNSTETIWNPQSKTTI